MSSRSWPPGRLVLQLALLAVLALTCFGTLGVRGVLGLALVAAGVYVVAWLVTGRSRR